VECHGSALEGHSGPPLAGDSFVSNWSGHPLVDLVDKIQKTMPFGQAGTVSRKQATDLAAYILQTNKFPSGPAELTDERLASIGFPGTRSTNNTAPAPFTGVTLPPPEGNLAELMRAIAFPNANIIFNVQVNDPAITHKREVGPVFDYTQWGAGIYQGWPAIDQAAIALTETAPLFLTPGRKCQNGRPVPVNRADWKQYTEQVMEVGRLAHRASQAQDREAFEEISEKLTEACQKCHAAYRREGAGAVRCQ
jgi:mono/diheme cytochrome c family protein